MSIEEAKFILNNVEIDKPSVHSQVYFSTEEINLAIETTVQKLEEKEYEVAQLETKINEILSELKNVEELTKENSIFSKLTNILMNSNLLNKKKNYKTMNSF